MNFYRRHIGDYARKAGHLSMLEHGAYTLILDAYYDREQPLTTSECMRICRASSTAERNAVKTVLNEFFVQRDDGCWVQNRVEEEIQAVAARAEIARQNGQKGGRPRKERRIPTETESVSEENPTGSFSKPNGNPVETQRQPRKKLIQDSKTTPSPSGEENTSTSVDTQPH